MKSETIDLGQMYCQYFMCFVTKELINEDENVVSCGV